MFLTVDKIPLITERSTATIIPFQKEREHKVLKQCIGRKKKSTVSHGVKSQPLSKATTNHPSGMNCLTNQLMVTTLPKKQESQNTTTPAATDKINYDDTPIFSIWEENYQDLSNWCMDTFIQDPCDFPVGEFNLMETKDENMENKSTEIKPEDVETIQKDNCTSIKMGDELWGEGLTNISMLTNNQLMDNYTEKVGSLTDLPMGKWLESPKSSIALRTDEWIKQTDTEAMDQSIKREIWDSNVLDNTESESFDLLSYLCGQDDDILSQNEKDLVLTSTNNTDKKPSRTSLRINEIKKKQDATLHPMNSSFIFDETDGETSAEAGALSPESSKSMEINASRRGRGRPSLKIVQEKISQGKKRNIDSDSDDGLSDCSSYRDTREKNNEASRKSRMNKKLKENEMMKMSTMLENDNKKLKIKAEKLEKLVIKMRAAILQSALNRNS